MSKKEDTNFFNYEKDTWKINEIIVKEHLVNHLIESFNNFIDINIPEIISQCSPQIIQYDFVPELNKYKKEIHIYFEDHFLEEPTIYENDGSYKIMTPSVARARQLTYSSPLYINLRIKSITKSGKNFEIEKVNEKELKKIHFGKIPIMIKSKHCILSKKRNIDLIKEKECPYDLGGYFLINGNEKIIICQESICENKIYVFNNIRQTKYLTAEIKSTNTENVHFSVMNSVKYFYKTKIIHIDTPNFKTSINIFIYFRLLGLHTDKELVENIVYDVNKNKNILQELIPSRIEYEKIINENEIKDNDDFTKYILNYFILKNYNKEVKLSYDDKLNKMYESINSYVLPHLFSDKKKKAFYFGVMINKLIKVNLGILTYDDRDDYSNKTIRTAQRLLDDLYKPNFKKLLKNLVKTIKKDIKNNKTKKNCYNELNNIFISKKIDSSQLETSLKKALAIGDFNTKNSYGNGKDKIGVSQALNRKSYVATLSHCRRVNSPFDKNSGKIITPRKLNKTHWGYICPNETPEGQAVGLVKNLAITAKITSYTSPVFLREVWCFKHGVKKFGTYPLKDNYNNTKIFVNGYIIGIHYDTPEFVKQFKLHRTKGIINIYTSMQWEMFNNNLYIYTTQGRVTRPLYIVENNKLNISSCRNLDMIKDYKSLFLLNINKENKCYIEFVDSNEVNNCLISINDKKLKEPTNTNSIYKYSHCEIHPSSILGILASLIPYPDHNQSPRNTYQSAMGKQAMGLTLTTIDERMDSNLYTLNNIEAPICRTKYNDILNCNLFSNGQHVIIAILSLNGYNQEDSLIVNKGAIDRGLFKATVYKTIKDEEKKNQTTGKEEKFCKPDKKYTSNIKPLNYDKIEENGFPKINTYINENDICIGKVIPIKSNDSSKKFKCISSTFKDSGFIHKTRKKRNTDGVNIGIIKKREEREPMIGDKFSSRCGQKGTIGMILEEEDIPFTKNGMKPALIINPHCIPSRMTIGQLIEQTLSTLSLHLGGISDCTAFCDLNKEKIYDLLEQYESDRHGYHTLYDGKTGKQLKAAVFQGPVFYQRLIHMVSDKMHARGSGPIVQLTRQPPEGRSRDGGLRIGEMERDCMIAHGTNTFLKESLLERSDLYESFICKNCGSMCIFNEKEELFKCKKCVNSYDFRKIQTPYATKLVSHELKSMLINMEFVIE